VEPYRSVGIVLEDDGDIFRDAAGLIFEHAERNGNRLGLSCLQEVQGESKREFLLVGCS
jgi:hypothetical protein